MGKICFVLVIALGFAFIVMAGLLPIQAQTALLEERTLLVDDFAPQPRQGASVWPHNRLGGDRGRIEGPGGGTGW